MRLYHGSDVGVKHPVVAYNEGFADLGRGFYLTDSEEVAHRRAASRARRTGGVPTVSVYELDDGWLPWVILGSVKPDRVDLAEGEPFGLCFAETPAGIAAWAEYIKACRAGKTEIAGLGNPVVVRAWIATEEIEMVCAGLATADDLAEAIEMADLVVQYCLTDQDTIDAHLVFVEARA